ncbi:Creatinase aminopeptidase [Flagelloscypha sp. PMI_526]|nr:Creatinase aminopeptidase [Flagelloscypha sp. PMI_526]
MAPPPPPPPMCLPFTSSKKVKRRLSWSTSDRRPDSYSEQATHSYVDEKSRGELSRNQSYSSRSTGSTLKGGGNTGRSSSRTSLTFNSDSEKYDNFSDTEKEFDLSKSKLARSNTFLGTSSSPGLSREGTKKSTSSSNHKWGYGWTLGRKRSDTGPAGSSGANLTREMSQRSYATPVTTPPGENPPGLRRSDTKSSSASKDSKASRTSSKSSKSSVLPVPAPRPRRLSPHDSSDTLIGSTYERKVNEPTQESLRRMDSTVLLSELRKLMDKESLDYYLIPHDDAHMSEYVAERDQRLKFISGFSGSAGTAIVTRSNAYLFVDSRYWLQAREQVDNNWTIVELGRPGQVTDWVEWLLARIKSSKIGLDARMLSHEKATIINTKLNAKASKLAYPPQNLVDLVWKDHGQPPKSKDEIYIQGVEFAGQEARDKLRGLRKYLSSHAPDVPSYSRSPATPSQQHTGILISNLPAIAWTLNLRGCDIPYNPLFHSYLFISLDRSYLFIDSEKVNKQVSSYLRSLDVTVRDYGDIWTFLRRREWGEGKVILSPNTSYAISLMLTHFRYTVEPSYIEKTMAIKNDVEIAGLKRAYLRDGVSFVRFLAWLDEKMSQGYEISEWEAGFRLTEFRRKNKNFIGIAYQNISATGANAALPHYSPKKGGDAILSRDVPYLNDSGGQYRDGTCDTTRTVHFGRPTSAQCEAYTRVLQGHIAIDSAIFPLGTSGYQLDVLARKALWKDGMNYHHGTGHGFGSFLTVHEGPHGFSSSIPLKPGHVITNEPGYYEEGEWGIRIESALFVKEVHTKNSSSSTSTETWLGFERFTCVPIQTRMIKEGMLTKEEKNWVKTHNRSVYDKVAPIIKKEEDWRALKWLKRETEREIGIAKPVLGGVDIDWG